MLAHDLIRKYLRPEEQTKNLVKCIHIALRLRSTKNLNAEHRSRPFQVLRSVVSNTAPNMTDKNGKQTWQKFETKQTQ